MCFLHTFQEQEQQKYIAQYQIDFRITLLHSNLYG